ncbi:Dabb family protein [Thermostaphylospora chromogena]|uniref:Stress responsive A/B Barrel Domain n=1 Tax=Thermostaphylospora chromogena TaxID=35622 RepID=A0A1H1BRS0_9ACTN|nr:Dabb family protein [Thermostaphylospora chromogena]SDQ54599.1 Stress responsive A/B Barrel Domain [Thermostaphylospora chromogena]
MFRHVVLFKWNDQATEERLRRMEEELRALPGVIEQIRTYEMGTDVGVNRGNYDFALVAGFDSQEDYLVYRDHPRHRAVIDEHITPILLNRVAVQFVS